MRLQVSPPDQSVLKSVVDWCVKNATATVEGWLVQHKDDGTHANVTAESIVVSGDATVAGEITTPIINGTEQAGLTLNSQTTIDLQTDDVTKWQIEEAGHLVPGTDDAYNVGAAATRIQHLYLGGDAIFGLLGGETVLSFLAAGGLRVHTVGQGGVLGIQIQAGTNAPVIALTNTNSFVAPQVQIGCTLSGAGAAGVLMMEELDGTDRFLWFDNDGVLRSHTTAPVIGIGDTAGTPYAQEGTDTATSPNITYASGSFNWQKTGRDVHITGFVTFPATADANQAAINNLPFTSENSSAARGGCVCHFSSSGAVESLMVLGNSTSAQFFNPATGAARTNANLTGVLVFFDFKYRAAS